MRYFHLDDEPTQEQLDAIDAEMVDGNLHGEDCYYVICADDVEIPEWLAAGEELGMPAESPRCPSCGELL